MNLNKKVAIVTGGSRDIGREVSIKLASLGAKVVVNYLHNPEEAEETLRIIKKENGDAIIVQGDMTLKSKVNYLVEKTLKTYGNKIDILVNVAGGLIARKKIEEMEEHFWDSVMNVNLKTTFLATQAVVPHMESGSSIINFSSQAARDGGGPGSSAYATAKGAVTTFTRAMAKELGPRNIRVNALTPGMIATAFHDTFTNDDVREHVANITPLRREGDASEVADLVAYLASDESSFVTGTNIDINGGTLFS